jgi:hypothetical protein
MRLGPGAAESSIGIAMPDRALERASRARRGTGSAGAGKGLLNSAFGESQEDVFQFDFLGGDGVDFYVGAQEDFDEDVVVHSGVAQGSLNFIVYQLGGFDSGVAAQRGEGAVVVLEDFDRDDAMDASTGHQFFDGAGDEELAALNDAELVTEFAKLGENVAGHENRFSQALQFLHELANLDSRPRIKT